MNFRMNCATETAEFRPTLTKCTNFYPIFTIFAFYFSIWRSIVWRSFLMLQNASESLDWVMRTVKPNENHHMKWTGTMYAVEMKRQIVSDISEVKFCVFHLFTFRRLNLCRWDWNKWIIQKAISTGTLNPMNIQCYFGCLQCHLGCRTNNSMWMNAQQFFFLNQKNIHLLRFYSLLSVVCRVHGRTYICLHTFSHVKWTQHYIFFSSLLCSTRFGSTIVSVGELSNKITHSFLGETLPIRIVQKSSSIESNLISTLHRRVVLIWLEHQIEYVWHVNCTVSVDVNKVNAR